ncbi:hypothetical protein C8J56DRAFT_143326 [Mycena floridula]|nr:hypothetical protein C8J56DRAFT_143326 [Mycena floridula]
MAATQPAGPDLQAGPSSSLIRFVVQSTDVLQDARVNVLEENSDKVIWYKERYLTDTEIVEHVVHNATTKLCWTIHRPIRGWYIRIRAPVFPPGVFIPLIPVPYTSPHHTEAALSFQSQTSIPAPLRPLTTVPDSPSVHSYPPSSPPPVIIHPPSPTSNTVELDRTAQKKPKLLPSTQVSEFILSLYSIIPENKQPVGLFQRALQVMRSHAPSHSNSFVLARIGSPPAPPPYAPDSPIPASSSSVGAPFLTFHDRTPVLTVRSLTGYLEIDQNEERLLGVETSFWITIALTYLEFLEERESYLAALSD